MATDRMFWNRAGASLALGLVVVWGSIGSSATATARSSMQFADSAAGCANVDYGRANLGAGADPATSPNPDGPTKIATGVFVSQLRSLDAVSEEYQFVGHVRATWCDPRLAYDAAAVGARGRVYSGPDADELLKQIWFISAFPANRAGTLEITERVVRVAPDGTVHNDLNFSVQLHADFDLRRFPFDRQTLHLYVESYRWAADDLVFVRSEESTGFAADFTMQEWTIAGVSSEIDEVSTIRGDRAFSRYVFEVEVARRSGFYLWKVMLPILIIVSISWSIFWMTDERLAGRSRITGSGVLTVVAYQFVVADGLPRIAYLTMLDKMMLVSFSLLAVTVVQSMLVTHYHESAPETAARIDRLSRWIFPLTYVALLAVVAIGSG